VNPEAEAARARAGLYRLLARMVAQEPDEAFIGELNAPDFLEATTALGLSPPPLPSQQDAQGTYEEWAAEYARLFILPGAPLQPTESVQRGEGRLWGEATVRVQKAYHEAGFALSPESHQIPDHLSVELEFMAHLATQEAELWEADSRQDAQTLQDRQRAFLRDHLGAWAVSFARKLREETSQHYYQYLAELLETVLESDTSFLTNPGA
jgi:TorA maturation chaperone TorD